MGNQQSRQGRVPGQENRPFFSNDPSTSLDDATEDVFNNGTINFENERVAVPISTESVQEAVDDGTSDQESGVIDVTFPGSGSPTLQTAYHQMSIEGRPHRSESGGSRIQLGIPFRIEDLREMLERTTRFAPTIGLDYRWEYDRLMWPDCSVGARDESSVFQFYHASSSKLHVGVTGCEAVRYLSRTNAGESTGLCTQAHHIATYHYPDFKLLSPKEASHLLPPLGHFRRFDPSLRLSRTDCNEHFTIQQTNIGDLAYKHLQENCKNCAPWGGFGVFQYMRGIRDFRRKSNIITEDFFAAMTRVHTFRGESKISMVSVWKADELFLRIQRRSTFSALSGDEVASYEYSMEEWKTIGAAWKIGGSLVTPQRKLVSKVAFQCYGILDQLLYRKTTRAYWSVENFLVEQGQVSSPVTWYIHSPIDELSSVLKGTVIHSKKKEDNTCAVCLEQYRSYVPPSDEWTPEDPSSEDDEKKEDSVQLTCGHIFGKKCMEHWSMEKHIRPTCPTCRKPIHGTNIPNPSLERWFPPNWYQFNRYQNMNLTSGWPADQGGTCNGHLVCIHLPIRRTKTDVGLYPDGRFSINGNTLRHHLIHLDQMLKDLVPSAMRDELLIMDHYAALHPEDVQDMDEIEQSNRLKKLRPPVLLTDHRYEWNLANSPEWYICFFAIENLIPSLTESKWHPECMYKALRNELATCLWKTTGPYPWHMPMPSNTAFRGQELEFPATRPGFVKELEGILRGIVEFARRSALMGNEEMLNDLWHSEE